MAHGKCQDQKPCFLLASTLVDWLIFNAAAFNTNYVILRL